MLPQLRATLSLRQMDMRLHRGLMQLKVSCSAMLLLQLEMTQELRTGTQDNMVATTADSQG